MKTPRFDLSALLLLWLTGCQHGAGGYVWVDEMREPAVVEAETIIWPGDTISVRVYQQDSMSARGRVRSDGKFSMPFLNDVNAGGLTPQTLSEKIQARLKEFLTNPVVTVSIEEVRQVSVSVLGEVSHPGVYAVDLGSGVLQSLAMAGGFTPFARKNVFVLRSLELGKNPRRIRFDYDSLIGAQGLGPAFRLRGGDVVVVE